MVNYEGPSALPCETPNSQGTGAEVQSPTLTNRLRLCHQNADIFKVRMGPMMSLLCPSA